jgi:son of sevenless-like protein
MHLSQGISQKHRAVFQEMHDLQDYSRNSARYRARLRSTMAPAVPFLGLVLTDVTFTREGNGAQRPSPADPNKMLINFNRYNRLAKILGGAFLPLEQRTRADHDV